MKTYEVFGKMCVVEDDRVRPFFGKRNNFVVWAMDLDSAIDSGDEKNIAGALLGTRIQLEKDWYDLKQQVDHLYKEAFKKKK